MASTGKEGRKGGFATHQRSPNFLVPGRSYLFFLYPSVAQSPSCFHFFGPSTYVVVWGKGMSSRIASVTISISWMEHKGGEG